MPEPSSAERPMDVHYRGPGIRGLLPSLAVNAAVPVLIYQLLTARGFTVLAALTVAAIFPLLGTLLGWIRARQIDVTGVVSLAFIAAGMASSLISGDPRFLLAKESFLTASFGLVCFGSLFMPRPLMFYFGRQASSMGSPEAAARFDANWQYPYFRFVIRRMTIVWGAGYLAEAAARILLLSILPIPIYLVISQGLVFGVTAGLIAWTISYARRASRRGAEMRARQVRSQDGDGAA